MTTSSPDWATVDDMSNCCMANLYQKLGMMDVDKQAADTLHMDIMPRRIDRKEILRSLGPFSIER